MTFERTVAFLDILGFKNTIFRKKITDMVEAYKNAINIAEAMNKPFIPAKDAPTFFPNHNDNEAWCSKYIFSDAIILISNSDTEGDALKLILYIRRLFQGLLAIGFPIRGGVVFDEVYEEKNRGIVLGKGLTLAYELEQMQDWIGVSIDESVLKRFKSLNDLFNNENSNLNKVFPKYLVPFKGGATKELYVISWRYNFIVEQGTRSLFDVRSDPTAVKKVENTLHFCKYLRAKNYVYEKDDNLPVELRVFWVGQSNPPFPHGDDL